MKIISNQKKIKRNYNIGMYTSYAALLFLFGAVIITFVYSSRPEIANLSFPVMAVGLIFSQIGVYFANRFGKSPRPDEKITASLKGVNDQFTLYHYVAPVPHLLVGPSGIWVIVAQYQGGTITYEKDRLRQKGVGFLSRLVGQEGIGRPDLEAGALQEDMEKFLKKSLPDAELPVQPLIVFVSPKASVQAPDSPIPTMHVDKLKDFVRRKTKESPVSPQMIREIADLLPEEDIV